jgi:hypothetical protein
MKKVVQMCCLAAAICLASAAFSQTSVTLTGPTSGPVYDGIYMSPYYATVGGVANTPVICDDFADDSYFGTTWNATVTPFSGITSSNTSWGLAGANISSYAEVGYFAAQILAAAPGSVNQIVNSFAMWAVFDPSGVKNYLNTYPVLSGALTTATLCIDIFGSAGCGTGPSTGGLLATFANVSGFSNFAVLSPDVTGTTSLCAAGHGCVAQEFIVSVPEGGTTVAYLLLAGFCCLGAMFLRSRRQLATRTTA